MIELVLEDRCIQCAKCAKACPNDVFDAEPGELPVIARKAECHTCFLCELYCPTDALYVSPFREPEAGLRLAPLIENGTVGSYGRISGWKRGAPQTVPA